MVASVPTDPQQKMIRLRTKTSFDSIADSADAALVTPPKTSRARGGSPSEPGSSESKSFLG